MEKIRVEQHSVGGRLFTGSYPPSLSPFGVGVMRWSLRVEAYLLLLVDQYPPFAVE